MGAAIRQKRMAKGWSQERLGERAGLDRRTISTIELGIRAATFDHLAQIAAALGLPPRHPFE